MNRLAGATERRWAVRNAGWAINRGAARNMILKILNSEEMENESRGGCKRRHFGAVVTMGKVMGPAFLSGLSRDRRGPFRRSRDSILRMSFYWYAVV